VAAPEPWCANFRRGGEEKECLREREKESEKSFLSSFLSRPPPHWCGFFIHSFFSFFYFLWLALLDILGTSLYFFKKEEEKNTARPEEKEKRKRAVQEWCTSLSEVGHKFSKFSATKKERKRKTERAARGRKRKQAASSSRKKL
jgi:hypothetical protein